MTQRWKWNLPRCSIISAALPVLNFCEDFLPLCTSSEWSSPRQHLLSSCAQKQFDVQTCYLHSIWAAKTHPRMTPKKHMLWTEDSKCMNNYTVSTIKKQSTLGLFLTGATASWCSFKMLCFLMCKQHPRFKVIFQFPILLWIHKKNLCFSVLNQMLFECFIIGISNIGKSREKGIIPHAITCG